MAQKMSTKIDSALQDIKNNGIKPNIHVPNQQSELELDVLTDPTGYDMAKRRKTSIQDDLFGDNMAINYPIPPVTIPYTSLPSMSSYSLIDAHHV